MSFFRTSGEEQFPICLFTRITQKRNPVFILALAYDEGISMRKSILWKEGTEREKPSTAIALDGANPAEKSTLTTDSEIFLPSLCLRILWRSLLLHPSDFRNCIWGIYCWNSVMDCRDKRAITPGDSGPDKWWWNLPPTKMSRDSWLHCTSWLHSLRLQQKALWSLLKKSHQAMWNPFNCI